MPTELTTDYLLGRCLVIARRRWFMLELDRNDCLRCQEQSDNVVGVFPRLEVLRLIAEGTIDIEA
jgi:hypothetical protein